MKLRDIDSYAFDQMRYIGEPEAAKRTRVMINLLVIARKRDDPPRRIDYLQQLARHLMGRLLNCGHLELAASLEKII